MAGYREFLTGDVLSAANVNNFLMEQATMTFADAAARDAALAGVLREGLLTYNLDTNRLEVYDGTAWVEPAPEPPAGIGSNVVQASSTAPFSASVTAGGASTDVLSATITPTSATSKILVFASVNHSNNQPNNAGSGFRLMRGSTPISVGDASGSRTQVTSGTFVQGTTTAQIFSSDGLFLDSPGTAAAVTYHVQIVNPSTSTQTVFMNRTVGNGDNEFAMLAASTLIVAEVAP